MNVKSEDVRGVHWSFRVIGGIGLIFNIAGVVNFIAQMNAKTIAAMPDHYRTIIEGRPAWATGAFAMAVFGGVLGCLLLLLRKKSARYVFIVSLFGAIVTMIHTIGSAPFEFVIGNLAQLLVTAFLIWYSKQAQTQGWIS